MKRNENLYTFLFEYKSQKYISQTRASEQNLIMDFQGGTYISQIKANTPAKAKLQWSKKMAKQQAGIWKDIQKNKSKQSIDSIPFEMNPSYLNVWNLEFLSGKEKATVYCIKTEE